MIWYQMRKLYTANNLLEAHIILHLLESAYVPARLFNVHAQGGVGDIPFTHAYPEVWIIRDLDYERGRAVITSYEHTPPVTGAIVCPQCGEENPYNFQLCWHCESGLEVAKENIWQSKL